MLKEKRINYAIGIILGCLLLGFMALPFVGEASCYDLLEMLSWIVKLELNEPLVTATAAFVILTIISVGLMFALAVTGFVFRCTKYKSGKAENVISWFYSSMIFAVIVTVFLMLILGFYWVNQVYLPYQYSMLVLLLIIYLLPYFCATKMNNAFVIYNLVLYPLLGIIIYFLHEKVFKKLYNNAMTEI